MIVFTIWDLIVLVLGGACAVTLGLIVLKQRSGRT